MSANAQRPSPTIASMALAAALGVIMGVGISSRFGSVDNAAAVMNDAGNGARVLQEAAADKPHKRKSVFVDVLTVGSGPGGQYSTWQLSKAFKGKKVALVSDDSRICGNIDDVELVGSTPAKPLRARMCAARINIATMPRMRYLAYELGIPLAFSPWNSHFHLQGEDAYNWRWNYGPDYPLNDTVVASYGGTNDIVQQTSATGSGVYNLVHWEPEHTTYGDPIDDAWGWALGFPDYSNPAPSFNGADPGPYDPSNPSQKHPRWQCSTFADSYSMFSAYFGEDWAGLVRDTNVGFIGDFTKNNEVCSYLATQYIQYNQADEGYPVGGMTELCRRMKAQSTAAGASFYYNQPVTSIAKTPNGRQFVVETPDYVFTATDLLLDVPPQAIAAMTGAVATGIASQPLAQSVQPMETVTITVQFDPATPRWWDFLLERIWGSYRRLSPSSCSNRIEIYKTPYAMYDHVMRAAYTDANCVPMWKNLIARGEAAVKAEVMRELHGIFDEELAARGLTLPEPILIAAHHEDTAWWYMTPSSTAPTWQALSQWANAPLGERSRVCINHGSTQIYYSGWAISAINRTDECLHRLYPRTFTADVIDGWRTANGRFVDDNSVLPGYSTPGLSTQYDYSNGLPNEIFPPYALDQPPQWEVPADAAAASAAVAPAPVGKGSRPQAVVQQQGLAEGTAATTR